MSYSSDLVRTKSWGTETLTASDLQGQLDLIIDWVMALANETTGHKHDATENEGPKIDLTTSVTGTLPLANGGTGQTTLAGLLSLVYPVGSTYSNAAVSTNPATLLGFGTWVAIEGECIVGLVAGGEFDTLGSVSEGETTHVLTEAELASHTHTFSKKASGAISSSTPALSADTNDNTNPGTTSATGSGTAHNNIQPSYVCYVWRRTA